MAKFNSKFVIEGIDKISVPFKNIAKMNDSLRDSFKGSNTALKDLQSKTAKIDSYHKHLNASKKLKQEYVESQKKLSDLSREYRNAEKPTAKMTAALKRARRETERLKDQHVSSFEKVKRISGALKEMGVEVKHIGRYTHDFRKQEKELQASLDVTKQKLDKISEAHKKIEKARAKRAKVEQSAMAMAVVGQQARQQGSAIFRTAAQPVSTAMDFESQMSAVGAKVSVAAKGSQGFENMKNIAMELGSSTSFSASEVAKSIELLGMAGVKANQINKNMVAGLLDTARAGGISLADATSLSTSVINGFGLDLKNDMAKVGDILAYTANNANTDMSEMAEVFKQVGPVAKTAGVDLKQVSGMIAVLSNVGVKSSVAGTTIKNTLLNLSSPAKSGSQALAKLGVRAKDTYGNLRPLTDIYADIAAATSDMGDTERLAIFKDVAGAEAVAGFSAFIDKAKTKEGLAELRKIETNMGEVTGTAKRMGKALSDNLEGDLTSLGSAFEGLNIVIGEMFTPILRTMTKALTSTVQGITKFSEENPTLTKTIVGLTIGFGGLLTMFGSLMSAMSIARIGIAATSFNMTVLKVKSSMAFGVMGQGLKTASLGFLSLTKKAAMSLFTIKGALVASGVGIAFLALGFAAQKIMENWGSIKPFFANLFNKIKPYFQGFIDFYKKNIAPIFSAIGRFFGSDEEKSVKVNNTSTSKASGESLASSFTPIAASPAYASASGGAMTLNATTNINISGDGDPEKIAVVVKRELGNFVDDINRRYQGRMND
ncbi:MAG: phage tail tape measure protein [Oligoflexales bacterium]